MNKQWAFLVILILIVANEAMGQANQPKPELFFSEIWIPMECVIQNKSAKPGEYHNPPAPVLILGDLQHPLPRALITENDPGSIKLKDRAALAGLSGYGISLGYGQADPDINIYRVGLKKFFSLQWLKTNLGQLSGYFELSFNHWEHSNNDYINSVSFSPVFTYFFGDESNLIRPYIEGGIGAAYIDEYHIADRNLSTNFQFEDRIGIGARIKLLDLNFSYMHYSNASIKDPNNGIDNLIFTTAVQF